MSSCIIISNQASAGKAPLGISVLMKKTTFTLNPGGPISTNAEIFTTGLVGPIQDGPYIQVRATCGNNQTTCSMKDSHGNPVPDLNLNLSYRTCSWGASWPPIVLPLLKANVVSTAQIYRLRFINSRPSCGSHYWCEQMCPGMPIMPRGPQASHSGALIASVSMPEGSKVKHGDYSEKVTLKYKFSTDHQWAHIPQTNLTFNLTIP